MPESRTYRRYPDQNTIGTAHDGQSGRGNSPSRPAAAYTPAGSGHGHTTDTGDTPPRIPPRHRDQTMRGGLPHVPGDIIARREPQAADITKDRGRTPSQDAQVVRPSTAACWVDVPGLSSCVGSWLWPWQQVWQQSDRLLAKSGQVDRKSTRLNSSHR